MSHHQLLKHYIVIFRTTTNPKVNKNLFCKMLLDCKNIIGGDYINSWSNNIKCELQTIHFSATKL